MTTITVSPSMCVAASDAAKARGILLPASHTGGIIAAALAAAPSSASRATTGDLSAATMQGRCDECDQLSESHLWFCRKGHVDPGVQPPQGGSVTEAVERYMDEIDAARAGSDWLKGIQADRCSNAPSHLETFGFLRNGVHVNGCLTVLWGRAGRMVASYAIVRDDANCSVLIKQGPVNAGSDQTAATGQGDRISTPVRCSQCGWLGDATELGAEGECGGEGCPGTAVSEISTPADMIEAWQDSEGHICGPQLAEAGLIAQHPASAEEAKHLDIQPGDSVWDLTDAGKAVLDAARGQGGSDGL